MAFNSPFSHLKAIAEKSGACLTSGRLCCSCWSTVDSASKILFGRSMVAMINQLIITLVVDLNIRFSRIKPLTWSRFANFRVEMAIVMLT